MVPILINKDAFEPSYDLKFTVQNHKYFCTNLYIVYIICIYMELGENIMTKIDM